MSVNTANTPDGRGVLIYNGEMILVYTKEVNLSFDGNHDPLFKGKKHGSLYLTSHRMIFISGQKDALRSFSMPFHCMRHVTLEQPIFGANFLKGQSLAQPGGNWSGEVIWKLTFNRGGCIDFGQALLKANDMANNYRPMNAPPAYAPPAGSYYAAPPNYYMPENGNYQGFQMPTHAFPDQPPADTVFMYEQPPPYSGIGPNREPFPAGLSQRHVGGGQPPSAPYANVPPYPGDNQPTHYLNAYPGSSMPPSYPGANAPPPSYVQQASALPQKAHID